MLVNYCGPTRKRHAIKIEKLQALVNKLATMYPDSVVCMDERHQCMDVLRVTNNGGDTEYLYQLLVE